MTSELKALQERIAELQEQNTQLRESAATFAQLAERLSDRLREESARNVHASTHRSPSAVLASNDASPA